MISTRRRSDENWDNYKKQRSFCAKLNRQTKEKYFSDINVNGTSDNKKFWKTIKPFFSNKDRENHKISTRGRNNSQHHEYLFQKHYHTPKTQNYQN